MYTIYSYWNAEQVQAVLNAIALTMNGGDYLGLLKALAIAGVLVAAGTALVRVRGEEPFVYFVMFALFYGTLFVPRATVTVQDLRVNRVYTVANVPLGVAFFASQTSHIGKWLTERFETNFTSIGDLKFAKTGMVFGSRVVQELQMMKVRSPSLQQDLILFVKDCVNPELLDNPTSLNAMTKATDLWGFIGGSGTGAISLNPGRTTMISGVAVPCAGAGGAYSLLNTALTTEANAQLSALGQKLNPNDALATTIIQSQIPDVESTLLNVSRTAQDSIKQGMVLNMMRDSQSTVAQLQGNPHAAQIALAVAMAEQSSDVSYSAMAKVAEGALPKLRNAIELIIISIFPIFFILVVIAGAKAGLVLKSYVMANLWIQLWAPLYAVINFLATKTDSKDLLGILHGAGGNTLENMGALANTALSNQSIAGLLTISVPIIALALVKGGEVAMSGVASSIMSPAQGAAQKAGDAIGQGNVTGGNVSWGNVNTNSTSSGNWSSGNTQFGNASANKTDLSTSWADPSMSTSQTPWGSFTKDGQGNVTGMAASRWDVGGAVNLGSETSRSRVDASSESARSVAGRSGTFDSSTASVLSNQTSAGQVRQNSTQLASATGFSSDTALAFNTSKQGSFGTEFGGQSTIQNQESASFASGFGLGGSVGASKNYSNASNSQSSASKPDSNGQRSGQGIPESTGSAGTKMGLDFGMRLNTGGSLVDSAAVRENSSLSTNTGNSASHALKSADSKTKNETDSGSSTATHSLSADNQKSLKASDQQSHALAKEQTAGTTHQAGSQGRVGGSVSSGIPVARMLLDRAGGNPTKALQLAGSGNLGDLMDVTQTSAQDLEKSNIGQSALSSGGQVPKGQGAVINDGQKGVRDLVSKANSAARNTDVNNQQMVSGSQHAAPDSKPNTDAAMSGYKDYANMTHATSDGQVRETELSQGAGIVAGALYRSEQYGVSTVMKNALGGGSGYKSPGEYHEALKKAAASNTALEFTLRDIGATGKTPTTDALDYIQSALKESTGKN